MTSRRRNRQSRRGRLGRCALPLLLVARVAVAQTGLAYGERLWRVGDPAADAAHASVDLPDVAPLPDAEGQFLRRLEALEGRAGPYAAGLWETLADMGDFYRAQGDLQGALLAYRRALHVLRVNQGLYSADQARLVRAELDLYRARGELAALDDRYDYYFRLFGSGRPPFDEPRLRAALGYLRWQREALRLEVDDGETQRLLALLDLNDELLAAVAAAPELDYAWRVELGQSQLKNLYLLYNEVPRALDPLDSYEPASPFADPRPRWEPEDFQRERLFTLRRGALARGAEIVRDLISDFPPGGDPRELAGLHLALADWYQWHGRGRDAAAGYAEVERLLLAAGLGPTLREWLAEPVELPANGAFRQAPLSPAVDTGARAPVRLRFDVSAEGLARNIEAGNPAETDGAAAVRAERALREVRFRPRWFDGRAEAVSGLEREYAWSG